VVGCGGTGGFVAEGLCRLLPSQAELVLIDHDRVEERNLGRSNFKQGDLGKYKSEALAIRLAREYDRAVAYSTFPAALAELRNPGLVIGCVDNGFARRDIAAKVRPISCWWIDSGNGENYGQVTIGNAPLQSLASSFVKGTCLALPLPTIQRPELLQQAPERRDCSSAVLAGEQGPTINQAMASLVVEVVRRLIEGACSWMQLYIDLDAGSLSPVLAAPETVERITGIKMRKLERR
jgi:molybdopterin/thiamine biosynthesis adenylyltransferase